jgi:hypothetical protein
VGASHWPILHYLAFEVTGIMTETVQELNNTIDRADEHTAMLLDRIEQLEADNKALDSALVKSVETDLALRIEIESLKIKLNV